MGGGVYRRTLRMIGGKESPSSSGVRFLNAQPDPGITDKNMES